MKIKTKYMLPYVFSVVLMTPESEAAAIATVVLLGGKRVKMTPNSFLMIHRPWAMAVGTSDEMTATADLLDKMDDRITSLYVDRLKKSGKESGNISLRVKRMMDAETWLTAQEALDMGFIDEIIEANKETNIIQMQPALARYQHTPAALLINNKPENMTAQEMLKNIRAMLGGAGDEPVTAIPATDAPIAATEPAPEMTAEKAKELLAAAGYAVLSQDELTALTAKMDEEKQTNAELLQTVQTVAAEVVALRNQVKAQVGAPSGGSSSEGKKETPKASPFDALAAIVNAKLTR